MITSLEASPPVSPAVASSQPQLAPRRIALTGFMGAGKSTVGRLLAEALGWRFFDTDAEVESKCGRTVADIFADSGEQAFRAMESHALARCLGPTETVLALGGGAPEILANRLLLEQTPRTAVVFLDAGFATLFDRCVLQEGAARRPVLLDPLDSERRLERRLPFYRRLANLRIDTEHLSPSAAAENVLMALFHSGEQMSPSDSRLNPREPHHTR